MASNCNSRPLAAEVLVQGKTHQLIRRQNYADLAQLELMRRRSEPHKAAEPRRGSARRLYSQ